MEMPPFFAIRGSRGLMRIFSSQTTSRAREEEDSFFAPKEQTERSRRKAFSFLPSCGFFPPLYRNGVQVAAAAAAAAAAAKGEFITHDEDCFVNMTRRGMPLMPA